MLIVGGVDGCGYDGQQNTLVVTIIGRATWFKAQWSRPVLRQIGQICCAYELLRYLNVEIRQYYFTPCSCAQGNN